MQFLKASIVLVIIAIAFQFIYQLSFFHQKKHEHFQNALIKFESLVASSNFPDLKFDNTKENVDNKFYTTQMYNSNDQLIQWSKSSFVLSEEILVKSENKLSYIQFNHENFIIKAKIIGEHKLVYMFELDQYISKFYQDKFSFNISPNSKYKVLAFTMPKAVKFNSSDGQFLFSLASPALGSEWSILLKLLLIGLSILLFLLWIYKVFSHLAKDYPIISCLLFLFSINCFRKILIYFKEPSLFYHLKLFSHELYHTELNPSLGDLFVFIFTSQLILYFIKYHFVYDMEKLKNIHLGFLIHTFGLIVLLGEAFSANKIFERLVVESTIWFNFNYFPQLSIYSFIGLAIMLMSFSNYYLLANLILNQINLIKLTKQQILCSFLIFLSIAIVICTRKNIQFEIMISVILLLIFILISYFKYYFNYRPKWFNVVLFLLFASSMTSFLLIRFNAKKEKISLEVLSNQVLIDYKSNKSISVSNYNYSIYIDDKIVKTNNLVFNSDLSESSYDSKLKDDYLYKSGQYSVIISNEKKDTISSFTQFSYIFCFNFILLCFFIFINYFVFNRSKNPINFNNLRSKILASIFFIVIIIFIGIGYFSYSNLRIKAIESQKSKLINNLENTTFSVNSMNDTVKLRNFLINESLVNKNIVILYNEFGHPIIGFSEGKQFENFKTISKLNLDLFKMNRTTLLNNKNNEIFVLRKLSSQISNIQFLSIQNKTNQLDGNSIKLIVDLLNIYVLIFLISIVLAIWIANQITKPLTLLTEKLSQVNVLKKSGYIDYKFNDEIGDLVDRYNIMVDEISKSAKRLAINEREEAWSSMAKQIAHEIRNPLTPMKLKIQFLQKKVKDHSTDIHQFTLDTSNALLEQINNLDTIASSFSNFSKLHNAKIEELDWILIIHNVVGIFNSEHVQVNFKYKLNQAIISCDQNQMISCLNNVIQNAIQSYPTGNIKVDLSLGENSSNFILSVKDYGSGISEQNHEKIFTPNFTTKSSGTGLGLAISRKIIESFEGQIIFKSMINQGTEFLISIPKQKYEADFVYSNKELEFLNNGLVHVQNNLLIVDLVYTSKCNVFNKVLYTDFNKIFLNKLAVTKLEEASLLLASIGQDLRLVIKDAFRPYEIQQLMWDSYVGDDKSKFIANPELDSLHNYGMSVDVSILRISDKDFVLNQELDFGSEFDEFNDKSCWSYSDLSKEQTENRNLILKVMTEAGFIAYENEWWHFDAMYKDWVRDNCERF